MNQLLIENVLPSASVLPAIQSRTSRRLRKSGSFFGAGLIAALMAGCGSSGSGPSFHAETRFAAAEEDDFATTVEQMENGEELRLPMAQQGYEVGSDGSASLSGQGGVFTLRADGAGEDRTYSVTIETAAGSFTWEAVSVGGGHMSALDTGGDGQLLLDLDSTYYDYVHFGSWEVMSHNDQAEVERTQGGAFRQGFETDPANMPTSGTATYQGESIARVISGSDGFSEPLYGTFRLEADFATLTVGGEIDHNGRFNDIQLDAGSIHDGSRFSGAAVAVEWNGVGGLTGEASGQYEGAFYGHSAEEAGATWSIREGDKIVAGAFGGPGVLTGTEPGPQE